MPSKNDLSALKSPTADKQILPESGAKRRTGQQAKGNGRVGRPKKAVAEKRDYKITLSLTQGEGAKIAAKAGLAPEAAYLYALLEKAGAFK